MLDLHTSEVSVTILALLATGLLLRLLQPIAAWRWAVLLALGLRVVAVVGHLLGMRTAEPIRLDQRIAVVGVAIGLVGCYTGVAISGCASDALVNARSPQRRDWRRPTSGARALLTGPI